MNLKIYGAFEVELKKNQSSKLESILLYGDGMFIAYFMTPIIYSSINTKELEARFDIDHQNIIIETGNYSLKLILDEKSKYSHVCLLKKDNNIYDLVFMVRINSIVTNDDSSIKVKFSVQKKDLDKIATSSSH